MQDPASLINVQSVDIRDDGVIQIMYAEPHEQSNDVSRARTICFRMDLIPKYLLAWMECTQDMIYAAILEQQNADASQLRPR